MAIIINLPETIQVANGSSMSSLSFSHRSPDHQDCQEGPMRHRRSRARSSLVLMCLFIFFVGATTPTLFFLHQGSRLLSSLSRTVVVSTANETSTIPSIKDENQYTQDEPSSTSSPLHRPLAILHIGPRKTATTTIQYVLNHETTKYYLQDQDHFVYYGKGGSKSFLEHGAREYLRDCLVLELPGACATKAPDWLAFVTDVQATRLQILDNNMNTNNNITNTTTNLNRGGIVISDEALSQILVQDDEPLHFLKEALAGFEIRIVATYRHHYEWLLSEYNQEYKRYKQGNNSLTLVDWYHFKQYVVPRRRQENLTPLTQEAVQHWRTVVDEVRIFNMHQGQGSIDLIQRFMCDMIPEAQHTCWQAQHSRSTHDDNGGTTRRRTSHKIMPLIAPLDHQQKSVSSMDAEYIAFKTFQKLGFLLKRAEVNLSMPGKNGTSHEGPKQAPPAAAAAVAPFNDEMIMTLDQFATQVQSFLTLWSSSIPKQCLKPFELEAILQKTLELQGDLLLLNNMGVGSTAQAQQDDRSISKAFQKEVNAGKYCNVDLEELWYIDSWQAFLNQTIRVF
jgi:hypothetical protein